MYEAANIHTILQCREKGKDKTPLWFMYVTATVQLLMVSPAYITLSRSLEMKQLFHYFGNIYHLMFNFASCTLFVPTPELFHGQAS